LKEQRRADFEKAANKMIDKPTSFQTLKQPLFKVEIEPEFWKKSISVSETFGRVKSFLSTFSLLFHF
jgi:hypothetical protein